jgi:antitoxin component YwqK of YwqJK toxin-antitoxin module
MKTIYKSAGKNNEYIVKMVIPDNEEFRKNHTNELRKGISDPKHAVFRTDKVHVIDIYHKSTLKENNSAQEKESIYKVQSNYDPNFVYIKGKIKKDHFDRNVEKVCSKGIHYYLTEEAAFFYEINLYNYSGKYMRWDNDGQIYKEGGHKNGKEEGLCKEWFPDGRKKSEGEYKNGNREGFWKIFDTNEKYITEGEYKNGVKYGSWKEWFLNGQPKSEREYKNGKSEGLWKKWYSNGQIKLEIEYKNGQLEGLFKTFYKNGKPMMEGEYKNGDRDGLWGEWHLFGLVKCGGMWIENFTNGQLEIKGEYKNGKKEGLWKELFTTELPELDGECKNVKLILKSEGGYKNGDRKGLWKEWFHTGQKSEGEYKKENREGLWKIFNENGEYYCGKIYVDGFVDDYVYIHNDVKNNIS